MNLHGWDTAFAVDTSVANAALALRADSLLVDFAVDDPDGLQVRAGGSFGGWQIVEGGSGQFLTLRMPIVDGWLVLASHDDRVDLTGTAFVASVALDLIPSTLPDIQNLRFDVSSAGKVGQPPEPGAITPIRMDDPDGRLDDLQEALLLASLATYVAQNADRISFVFATVNLVPPQTDSWLAPVRSEFAYADRSDGSGGALVILSVTDNRPVDDLPRSIDPALLDGGHQAAFAFSRALLLEHVIMPSLPAAFGHGATPASFAYDAQTGQIVNLKRLDMNSVREGAIDYHPEIGKLRLGIDGSDLRGRYEGWCDLKAGISMDFWIHPENPIVYDDRTKALAFLADGSPKSGYDADIPWYWWLGGPLVRAIVEIVVPAIASGIADSLTSSVGSMLSPARNPPTSIRWAGTEDLQIATAWVDDDFVMTGDFTRVDREGS
ncbi:TULIP family P47-like protein [Myceligenerans salitolerans]|uniref:TULIP family P47-like protein n=1 Tax=Myceligenerans salitolerans TaxID=1230528 RepID=A0ABS3ID84_9MICO|nr:TULIP family P47-like protein [Myceligenerans salitolerans]MBO0610349.1 TULIP family P47-like protein [Myceligenerans salitolerans]